MLLEKIQEHMLEDQVMMEEVEEVVEEAARTGVITRERTTIS